MTNWGVIIAQAQGNEQSVNETLRQIYQDPKCREKAQSTFKKYKNGFVATAQWVTATDILSDSAERFIDAVRRGVVIKNGEAFFVEICKNYCRELTRTGKNPINHTEDLDPMKEPIIKKELVIDTDYDWCKTKLLHYVSMLPTKCQELMQIMYFNDPPEEDLVVIADLLGWGVKSVQPRDWACRKALAKIIGNQLDDCQETLFKKKD